MSKPTVDPSHGNCCISNNHQQLLIYSKFKNLIIYMLRVTFIYGHLHVLHCSSQKDLHVEQNVIKE